MTIVNPENIADILAECAQNYILPRYQALEDHEISTKTGPRDLVTQADIDVEAHLERVLPDLLPGSVVAGEEGISRGDVPIEILDDNAQKIWVVDPVDGTHNFVHHKREFGIMLALVINGQTEASWIYDVLGETCAITEKGSGAYFGDVRLNVSDEVDPANISGHINPRYFPEQFRDELMSAGESFAKCQRLHCAAHEYLRIAKGEAHFSVYSKLKPWDHLAGALMVEEAGGFIQTWDRKTYTAAIRDKGIIASNNQEIWDAVYDAFLRKFLEA